MPPYIEYVKLRMNFVKQVLKLQFLTYQLNNDTASLVENMLLNYGFKFKMSFIKLNGFLKPC